MRNDTITRAQAVRYILAAVFLVAAAIGLPLLLLSTVDMAPPRPVPVIAEQRALPVLGGALVFRDPAAQSKEFIGYYHTIAMTPEQEAIKKEVLGAMPAPCCSGSSAYTCCCPCNLSKTMWGLSNYVITVHGADATQLRAVVDAWTGFVNPRGYSGTACYKGGRDRSLSAGGCGGMQESKLEV